VRSTVAIALSVIAMVLFALIASGRLNERTLGLTTVVDVGFALNRALSLTIQLGFSLGLGMIFNTAQSRLEMRRCSTRFCLCPLSAARVETGRVRCLTAFS